VLDLILNLERRKKKKLTTEILKKSLGKKFSPEFLNRIDEIVVFNQLDQEEIIKIVKIEINKFISRLSEIDYTIKLDSKAIKFLANKGYDKDFGARPVKRAIQKYIEDEIAKRIVKNEIKKGDIISITHNKGEDFLIFNV
jgi:ATP-dependent Clp protease ATP-binding subunit ClpC